MKSRFAVVCLLVLFGAMTFVIGCSKEQAVSDDEVEMLAAKVGDWTLTRAEIDELIETLPDHQKQKYDSPEGRVELADRFIEEEVYHQESLKAGYDKDETVQEMVERYKRSVMVSEFFNREVRPQAKPTDQEIHDFYESNMDKYTTLPIAKAQHVFSADSLKLVGYLKQVEDGEPLTTIAHKYSEDDLTRPDGGNLGYFNPGGYIRGIGYSQELSDAAFSMEKGEIRIIKWKNGYSLFRLNELRPAALRPYDEVEGEIADLLTNQVLEEIKDEAYKEMKAKYEISNYLADDLNVTKRTPEELWNLAQNSTDSHQRLRYYQQIVDEHADSKYAAEALFMIGFVYAEEIKSAPDADRAFTQVINEYPDSEVAKTAKWMLENMSGTLPDFEGLDDIKEHIESQSE